jgi:hypothetical protein
VARIAGTSFGITPGQRFATGLIATVRHGGAVESRHFVGTTTDALTDLAAWCDAVDGRIKSISTPQTIYRDLHGSRRVAVDRQAKNRKASYSAHYDALIEIPEPKLLGRIGRKDLLDA